LAWLAFKAMAEIQIRNGGEEKWKYRSINFRPKTLRQSKPLWLRS
jgi:hypothetical protein